MTTNVPAFSSPVDVLAAILRGDPVAPRAAASCDAEALFQAAADHDIVPLLAEAVAGRDDMPDRLVARLRDEAQRAVVLDLVRESELARVLAALSAKGVSPLIIKGSHLAYTHYARPDLRARVDSDLLIPQAARDTLDHVLTIDLGYEASTKVSGDLTATQKTYFRTDGTGLAHAFDVHWRLSCPQVFAHVLRYDELAATAVPLPRLGPSARGPSNVHALLVACVHRVAHHAETEELKWLWDIHLLASSFTSDAWEVFVGLASERKVATVCRHSLERAAHWFHTVVPQHVWSDPRLSNVADQEVTAAYLTPRVQLRMVLDDLRALPTWTERRRLAREHLFPSAEYMRTLYAPHSSAPLSFLYTVRLVRGALKWIGI